MSCSQSSGPLSFPLHISAWSCWSITIAMADGRTDNGGFDHWQLMRERGPVQLHHLKNEHMKSTEIHKQHEGKEQEENQE